MDVVFDEDHVPQQLGDSIGRPGGEGIIHVLCNEPNIVVKIYHQATLGGRSGEFSQKVAKMTSVRKKLAKLNVCWPLLCVYDAQKNWIGYAMNLARGVSMSKLSSAKLRNSMLYEKYFPNLDRVQVVRLLLNLIETMQRLHAKDVYIGDYNRENFLCNPHSLTVTLIDCDSYQVKIDGKNFLCRVGFPDSTPPEHQGKDFHSVERNAQSEAFSAAVIFFQCLMLGRHPYSKQGGEDPATNIKNGGFPYGPGGGGISNRRYSRMWENLSPAIQSLFVQTFQDGHKNPNKRPSFNDWRKHLNTYLDELQKGQHNREIWPMA